MMSAMTTTAADTRRVVRVGSSARFRRYVGPDDVWLGTLVVLTLVLAWALVRFPDAAPLTSLILPMALGTLLVGPSRLPWFVVFVLAVLSLCVAIQASLTMRQGMGVLVIFVYGLIVLLSSFRRSRLGVSGLRGESMLVDLRDRITDQGRLPALPRGWFADSVLRSAGGTPFAGDFVVANLDEREQRLDLVVVDVSGKGEAAGTRALLLSGSLGGLLGALPPVDFLPAANDYLMRQGWDEGFATAIQLSVWLESGDYELRTAGHPPALHLHAGSGRWRTHGTEGPVLGLVADARFTSEAGTLQHGDVVLLFTDGLVETVQRDLAMGIDRLRGRAERLLTQGVEGAAERLVSQLGSTQDDRALVVVQRR